MLAEVVKWMYKGGNQNVKVYSQSLGLSNKKYKDIFNARQRKILDTVVSSTLDTDNAFGEYDISLLYSILQNFCGLKRRNSPVWTSQALGESMEYLIYILKEERNEDAHKKHLQQMSDTKVKKKAGMVEAPVVEDSLKGLHCYREASSQCPQIEANSQR